MKKLDKQYYGYNDTATGVRFHRDSRHAYGNRFQVEHSGGVFSIIGACIFIVALIGILMLFPGFANAQSVQIYDRATGKYLGNLNNNKLDPNSVSNPMGRYGSPLSPDSINNSMGQYGSPLSNSSVNNPYATNAPILVAPPANTWRGWE